ncbi:hypothetical protein [Paractinoplanes atraurantiacus]|uniref:DUF2158 domain-containing protein n=1 Tax=Paractinoplanes atraurantiacus TaxID=1036182 RepID=A0A285JDQ4_9ACTN|nr:hypothetical protein SAMN05421748_11991 [Actinoplanes atraurantiacus]
MHQQVQLHPGEVLLVGADASVQFEGARALTFRLIRVDTRSTYDGWLWLEGYVLGPTGVALQRRRIFVRREGLRPAL